MLFECYGRRITCAHEYIVAVGLNLQFFIDIVLLLTKYGNVIL